MFRIDGQRRRVFRDIPGHIPHRPARLRPDAEGLRSVESAPQFPAGPRAEQPPGPLSKSTRDHRRAGQRSCSQRPNSGFAGASAGIDRVMSQPLREIGKSQGQGRLRGSSRIWVPDVEMRRTGGLEPRFNGDLPAVPAPRPTDDRTRNERFAAIPAARATVRRPPSTGPWPALDRRCSPRKVPRWPIQSAPTDPCGASPS